MSKGVGISRDEELKVFTKAADEELANAKAEEEKLSRELDLLSLSLAKGAQKKKSPPAGKWQRASFGCEPAPGSTKLKIGPKHSWERHATFSEPKSSGLDSKKTTPTLGPRTTKPQCVGKLRLPDLALPSAVHK